MRAYYRASIEEGEFMLEKITLPKTPSMHRPIDQQLLSGGKYIYFTSKKKALIALAKYKKAEALLVAELVEALGKLELSFLEL